MQLYFKTNRQFLINTFSMSIAQLGGMIGSAVKDQMQFFCHEECEKSQSQVAEYWDR